jgi:DNA polymerase-3 subunit epsilon
VREIVFDTETTGLSYQQGHKVIEIGALELINRMPTGRNYHQFINPERDIDESAIRIHGIDNDRVANEPTFKEIAEDFLEFIADSPLIAHNATFDIGFLNYELTQVGYSELTNEVVDTLVMARKQFPGARASLDSLCQRFEIDLSSRTFHGALLDSELLADVYLELTGGRQPDMVGKLQSLDAANNNNGNKLSMPSGKEKREPRAFPASEEELSLHKEFISKIENSLW